MLDILNSAIKKNKPHLVKKLIKDINKHFGTIEFDDVSDSLGCTLPSPVKYFQTYLELHSKFLAPIYNNKNPLDNIHNLVKSKKINETLVYVCVIFNICIKELLELDNLWIDEKFIKKIIRNNTPDDIFILNYILKRQNNEDLKCFYKSYFKLSNDDIIILFINSPYCNSFDDFFDFYNQFDHKKNSYIYQRLHGTKQTALSKNIKEWLYLHKLSYYDKIINLLLIK